MISPAYENPRIDENAFFKIHPRVRHLRNLYFMSVLQLTIVVIVSVLAMKIDDYNDFLAENFFILYIAVVIMALILVMSFFFRSALSQSPLNYFAYFLFTLSFSLFGSYLCISNYYEACFMIIMAGWITAVSLWIYSLTTKCEFTYQGATLFLLAAVFLLLEGFLLYSSIRVDILLLIIFFQLIWGFYLVYDTQTIVSGVKYDWNKDDFVLGSIGIYVDILVLFLRLCELVKNLIVKERN